MSKLGKQGTKWSFLSLIKLEKDKLVHSVVFPNFKETKKRERTSHFSLQYRAIRPSAVFEIRRKAALCGAGYAWTPDLRSFDKLREVGVSPYLGFTLYLCVFQCFGWFEAVRGRLIGPKTWDRIVKFFLYILGQSVVVGD